MKKSSLLGPVLLPSVAAAMFALPASAAVSNITSATFSPGTAAQDDAETITAFTSGAGTFTNLLGATTVTGATGEFRFYTPGEDPGATPPPGSSGSGASALVGLVVTDGVLNTVNGTQFRFGQNIAPDATLFLTELGTTTEATNNNDVTLGLVDGSGSAIAGFTLTLTNIGGSNTLSRFNFASTRLSDNGTGPAQNDARLFGASFTLADFTNGATAFSGTNAQGVFVVNRDPDDGIAGNSVDISAVGLAVVPEPASLALVGLGSVLMLGRRRG